MKGQTDGSIKRSSNRSWHFPAYELIWYPLCNAGYYTTVENIQWSLLENTALHRLLWRQHDPGLKRSWSTWRWGEMGVSHWMARLWDNRRPGSEKASMLCQGCGVIRARAHSWGTYNVPTMWMLRTRCTFGKGCILPGLDHNQNGQFGKNK